MFWGCFAASGSGWLVVTDATMNSAFYQKILKENVWFAVHFLTAPKQKCLESKKTHLMPLKVAFFCTSGPFPVQFSGNPFHSSQSWVSLMMRAEPHATTGWPNRSFPGWVPNIKAWREATWTGACLFLFWHLQYSALRVHQQQLHCQTRVVL